MGGDVNHRLPVKLRRDANTKAALVSDGLSLCFSGGWSWYPPKQIAICGDDGMAEYRLEDLFDLQMGKTPAWNESSSTRPASERMGGCCL